MEHVDTPTNPTNPAVRPSDAQITRFVSEVQREATRIVSRGFGCHVADEVVSVLGERIGNDVSIVVQFDSGTAYARVAANNAALDVLRRERGQRGEGAALVVDAEGNRRVRRVVLSGDVTVGEGDDTVFSLQAGSQGDLEAFVVEAVDGAPVVDSVLALLTEAQRTVFVLVEGYGFEVSEAAVMLGVVRETASRHLSAARRIVRAAVGPDQFGLAA